MYTTTYLTSADHALNNTSFENRVSLAATTLESEIAKVRKELGIKTATGSFAEAREAQQLNISIETLRAIR